jgi:uncharacterized delta-60 repeat protein
MVKKRSIVLAAALAGTCFIGVVFWLWNGAPSTSSLRHAEPVGGPKASFRLIAPGILSIALASRNTWAAALALQGDGTIVLGATTSPKVVSAPGGDNQRGVVLRLTSNGQLANPVTHLTEAESIVTGVSTARDRTVAVAGYGRALTNRHFLLARMLPNGALDPAFGGGVVLADTKTSMFVGEAAQAVAIQSDDKIVVTGNTGYSLGPLAQASYCATARFTRAGRFDRTFGDRGRVLTLIGGKERCGASAVLIAPDGKIVVAGDYGSEREPRHIAVLRYLPDGALDRQFGADGIAELLQISASARSAAFDSQGRIVVVGTEWLSPSRTRFLVVRFDTAGKLDQSFGANGIVSLQHEAAVSQWLYATALEPDGKIVAVGVSGYHRGTGAPEPGNDVQIAVVRLAANGTLDTSFASSGLLLMPSSRYLWAAHGVAIQPDGEKLLIAGYVTDEANDRSTAIMLGRLNRDGTPDAGFGRGVDAP